MFYVKRFSLNNSSRTIFFNPLWVSSYKGFDVHLQRSQKSIAIAVLRNGTYLKWDSDLSSWTESESAFFYSVTEIRQRISAVRGGIQFEVNKPSTGEIWIGYFIEGDSTSYFLEFGLPNYLQLFTHDIVRWCNTIDGETDINIPVGLESERIIKAKMIYPASPYELTEGMVKEDSNKIYFFKPLSNGDGRLSMEYKLQVTPVLEKSIHQITTLPSVAIIPQESINHKEMSVYSESVTDVEGILKSITTFQCDQRIEISVFAETVSEARMIVNSIMNQVATNSEVFLPPYDQSFYLRVLGEIEVEERYANIKGNIKSCKFPLLASMITQG